MEFGVITYRYDNNYIIVMEGLKDKLSEYLEIVKEIINKDAEIKLVDEEKYNNCKGNSLALNELLN